jgi:ribosomal protein S18 acetylase RimI-like enzyme
LDNAYINRIGEIDRSEHVTRHYVYNEGKLEANAVDWQVARWADDDSAYSVTARIKEWSALLDQGSVLLGALEEGLLVGFAIFRPQLTETMAQLAVLHVSKEYRRQGVAQSLTAQVIDMAIESGAVSLYVSATPTESAVGFYQSQGFKLAQEVHPELYALEPEDIHMIKQL